MEERRRPDETGSGGGSFIRERIQEKPNRAGRLAKLTGGVIVLGALFGLVASLTFSLTQEPLRRHFGQTEPPGGTVSIPQDTMPSAESFAEPASGSGEETETQSPESVTEPASETQSPESVTEPASETQATETAASGTEELPPETTAAAENEKTEGWTIADWRESVENIVATVLETAGAESRPASGEPGRERDPSSVVRVKELVELMRPSLVTVTSLQANEDVFNRTYTRSRESFGVVLAVTASDIRILTESSLLEDADRVQVALNRGKSGEAELVGIDRTTGMAVISLPLSEVDARALAGVKAAALGNSYRVHAGDMVVALGNPMGHVTSVAWGIVSYVEPEVLGTDVVFQMLRTDIVGAEDGSGILVNVNGEVVGWITRNYREETGVHMLAAYSLSDLKSLLERLSNGDEAARLGLMVQTVTAAIAEEQELPRGLYISEVQEDSPAFEAGIREGDILVELDGQPMLTVANLRTFMLQADPGQETWVKVMRKGRSGFREQIFDVTLASR